MGIAKGNQLECVNGIGGSGVRVQVWLYQEDAEG